MEQRSRKGCLFFDAVKLLLYGVVIIQHKEAQSERCTCNKEIRKEPSTQGAARHERYSSTKGTTGLKSTRCCVHINAMHATSLLLGPSSRAEQSLSRVLPGVRRMLFPTVCLFVFSNGASPDYT